jgi:hypothetical protein
MALKQVGIVRKRWVGLSTDTKPTTDVNTGDTFFESDTRDWYVYNNAAWTSTGKEEVE